MPDALILKGFRFRGPAGGKFVAQEVSQVETAIRIQSNEDRLAVRRGENDLVAADASELEIDATPGSGRPDYDALLRPFADIPLADLLGPRLTAAARDLPAEALLLKALAEAGVTGYQVVVGDREVAPGSDRRQEIACAVLTRFPVSDVRRHPTLNARTILEVRVEVDGAPLTLFANHWKSGAGDPATESSRVANARTLRTRLDEILRADPHADLIIGGDLNSQYNQKLV